MQTKKKLKIVLCSSMAIMVAACFYCSNSGAYTANKVWMEFRPNGRYRVYVNYTIPELKEFRESYVEFSKKREAEKFYFDLVKGVDFYAPNPQTRKFVNPPKQPQPW